MKPIKYLILLFCITLSACKKDKTVATDLAGEWKLSEYYISSGGPGEWKAAEQKTQIKFGSNGTMSGNAYPDRVKYAIKDSVTLSFYDNKNSVVDFRYRLKNGTLTLSPTNPVCIEGCASKFIKINN
jgi:hypothetical protein